ncbi:MAG: VOC family protein [Desulfovibrionaceae bacterium]
MHIKFDGPAVLVNDMAVSRAFYEGVLELEVLMDNGPHVAYQQGFSLWQADHAMPLMVNKQAPGGPMGHDNFELYFESTDLEKAEQTVRKAGAAFIHPIIEQPWGQRCLRLRDPDGHVLEIGEPLPQLVQRLLGQGLTMEQVAERTSMPLPLVRQMAGSQSA